MAHLRIRLPRSISNWLKEQAARNFRSQGAEIAAALQARMDAQKETAPTTNE